MGFNSGLKGLTSQQIAKKLTAHTGYARAITTVVCALLDGAAAVPLRGVACDL